MLNSNVYFSTYLPYSFKHWSRLSSQHKRINICDRCYIGLQTTWQSGHFFSTLSQLWANFLHKTCIAGLGIVTIQGTHFRVNGVGAMTVHSRENEWQNAIPCGLLSTVMLVFTNKFPTKRISRIFHILKMNRMVPLSKLFNIYGMTLVWHSAATMYFWCKNALC